MTNAPEKIWAAQNKYSGATMWWPDSMATGIEYTRSDIAQAMVAAALERAEELASLHSDWSADEIKHYRRETQKDARAALDAMLAKAREDALRDAASVCRDNAPRIEHDSTQDDRMHEAILERAARHIEALIDRTAEGEA